MALSRRATALLALLPLALLPELARAQSSDGDAGAPSTSPDGGVAPAPTPSPTPSPSASPGSDGGVPELVPPRAIVEPVVPYPEGAPAHTTPIVVQVKLLVGVDGTVQKVELMSAPQPPFDGAVMTAVLQFRFQPALYRGKPAPVAITFTHTFLPPAPPDPTLDPDGGVAAPTGDGGTGPGPAAPTGPRLDSVLRGRLLEMGTRGSVANATITAQTDDWATSVDPDDTGAFRLALPSGMVRITIQAPGYLPFAQKERMVSRQELVVTYLVERGSYDPYRTVVRVEARREEVSRVTLRGPEIKQVPGTFGDPFRVVQALPGVSSIVSLLPFPIVRGASPSSTGFLLDGTRVPLLYHLLSGPSVIHPEFIDEIQFYPGGAPVPYGGYVGGIIDGRTRRARADEKLLDFDANLLLTGGLVRRPIKALDATFTVSGRYGYPGLLLSLATNEASLKYWDYQLRLDGGTPRKGWTVFAYGARDQLDTVAPDADPADPTPPLEPSLILGFHRLDTRIHRGSGKWDALYRLVLGQDRTLSGDSNVTMWVVEPSSNLRYTASKQLALSFGVEGAYHDTTLGTPLGSGDGASLSDTVGNIETLYSGGALTEALWRPNPRWLLRPGVRVDVMNDGETTTSSVDPRLTARYRLTARTPAQESQATWLKGGLGIYHQPPRFVVPLPGLDTMPLKYGLLKSIQASVGAEVPLANRLGLTVETYYNHMDPTIFDLSINQEDINREANGSLIPDPTMPPESRQQDVLDRLTAPQTGRSYGLEMLLRREAKSGLYGWLSYTLSRSERKRDGAWVPYDFDRTHLLNLVAGLPLPRNWDLGARLQYQSGKPVTTTSGYNTARTDGYVRIDLRVDKRAVWNSWLLDFYVDIINVALLPEEVSPGNNLRFVLPTIGVRGRF